MEVLTPKYPFDARGHLQTVADGFVRPEVTEWTHYPAKEYRGATHQLETDGLNRKDMICFWQAGRRTIQISQVVYHRDVHQPTRTRVRVREHNPYSNLAVDLKYDLTGTAGDAEGIQVKRALEIHKFVTIGTGLMYYTLDPRQYGASIPPPFLEEHPTNSELQRVIRAIDRDTNQLAQTHQTRARQSSAQA
ncbi:hypothetical protein HYS00_00245 [Candidatus Microgenomates bacterium]|nr:hypothetical protein [Candidatus Microgenomates bacterium]